MFNSYDKMDRCSVSSMKILSNEEIKKIYEEKLIKLTSSNPLLLPSNVLFDKDIKQQIIENQQIEQSFSPESTIQTPVPEEEIRIQNEKQFEENFYHPPPVSIPERTVQSRRVQSKRRGKKKSKCKKIEKLPRIKMGKKTRRKVQKWTQKEKDLLANAVKHYNSKNWKGIAEMVGTKTAKQCNQHWYRVLSPQISKSKWNEDEDEVLLEAVKKYGESKWKAVSLDLRGRTDIQCRHRFFSLKKVMGMGKRMRSYLFADNEDFVNEEDDDNDEVEKENGGYVVYTRCRSKKRKLN